MDTGTHHLQELLTRSPSRTSKVTQYYSRESLLLKLRSSAGGRGYASITASESDLLQRCASTLPIEKWGPYLVSWVRALEVSHGSSERIFSTTTTYERAEIDGMPLYCLAPKGLLTLEERNRLIADRKPYTFPRGLDHFEARLHPKCVLCQSIGESLDADLLMDSKRQSVILSLGDHVVVPNRYPAFPGSSMFMSINHDDMTLRVRLSHEISAKDPISPESRKTRGRLIKERELTKLFSICDALSLVATKNHVLDGMSVLGHDHFHLIPEEFIPEEFVRSVLGPHVGLPMFEAKGSPFSTLVVTGESPEEISSVVATILARMEEANEIYTIAYAYRCFFISSRWSEKIGDVPVRIGAGLPLHFIDPSEEKEFAAIQEYCPRAGEFNWNKFLL